MLTRLHQEMLGISLVCSDTNYIVTPQNNTLRRSERLLLGSTGL